MAFKSYIKVDLTQVGEENPVINEPLKSTVGIPTITRESSGKMILEMEKEIFTKETKVEVSNIKEGYQVECEIVAPNKIVILTGKNDEVEDSVLENTVILITV